MRRLGALIGVLAVVGWSTAARGGDVVGEVRFLGPAPAPTALRVNANPEYCGATVDDQAVVVSAGHLENVVVTVKGEGLQAPPPQAARVVLDQSHCHYVPHVQAVAAGSTLEIVNSDPLLHNIHGRAGGTTAFNLAMPVQGMRVPRLLARPELVHVQCDVHAFMSAWVVVSDTPFAVVGPDGRFVIRGLPAGRFTVTAWHEKLGTRVAEVTVPAAGDAAVEFSYGG